MNEEHVKYLEEIAGKDKVTTDIEDKICFGFKLIQSEMQKHKK